MVMRERGDTLIEVMLGIAILSIIIVGAITLTGFGIAQSQTAVEHSQTRAQINGQGNVLEYLRDQYIAANHANSGASATWIAILTSYLNNSAVPAEVDTCSKGSRPFYLNQSVAGTTLNAPAISTAIGTASTNAQPGQGLWIDAYRPTVPAGNPRYIDFVIKGCWNAIGGGAVQQEASIVRLYDGN